MTSIAINSSAAAPQNTTNASTSLSIGSTRSPTSGQSASATVQTSAPAPRATYATAAQNARKAPSGPGGNAASSSSTAPSQASGGGASGQHARSASTTSVPVNGKSITPAVPTLGNGGNSNGASTTPFSGGQHSRKPSIATMSNGSSRGAPNIKFGAINDSGIGPQTSGSAVAAGNNNLTAPMAQNPRASSPSPAAIQPAASGGGLPPTPGAAKPIQFGDTTPQQRHVQPHSHNPPQGPGSMGRGGGGGGGAGGHSRHDSAHSESVPHMPHGRGMPQAARGRSHYPPNPFQSAQYGGGGGNQGGYNVGRGGYQGQGQHQQRNGPTNMGSAAPFPAAPFPQQQFPKVPRSPALSHVAAHQSPSITPAIPTPQLYPQPHGQPFGSPQVQYMQQIYSEAYYPQPYGMQAYQQFPQTSPRTGYSQPVPSMGGGGFPYTPQQPTPMSRSPSSHNIEIRPPSSIGQHGQHGPPHGPHGQMMMGASPQQSTPVPSQSPHRQAPKSKAITIRDPGTGAPVIPQPTTPVAAVSSSIIVESPSPASGRTPSRSETPNNRSTSRCCKTAADKRREMREKVMAMAIGSVGDKKTQDAKATEEKKKQEEEAVAAAAIAKDEAEAKAKAEAEAKAKAKEEQEERAKKEAEEKAKAKAEAEAKEKAEAEAKAKAEKEAEDQRIKEAAEKEAKEAEEAAAAAKAKEEAEEAAAAAKAKEEADAKAKAEAEAEAAAESAKVAEAKVEAEKEAPLVPAASPKVSPPDDGESMPPPSAKTAEKPRSKPSPLNFQIPTTDAGLPSAQLTPQLTALRSARPVDNLMGLQYPEGIASPNPALNPLATATKFKYDKDFLMQFQTVFTEKPSPDWDQRMLETVGESEPVRSSVGSARPSSGLGGTRSTSSRGAPMFVGVMGSFTGPASAGSKAASMSSAERFKHSTNAGNPLAAGGLMFPRTGSNVGRTNSGTSLSGSASGALPQSPRATGSRSARGSSKRGNTNVAPSMERSDSRQQSSQPTIPLSDVKPLPVSANRWKPGRLKGGDSAAAVTPGSGPPGAAAGADGLMSPEMVQRKVKAALNKMTPEKFDKISDQILEITGQSKHESDGRTLRQVIQLTFEKATDEAHWASMYAKFCKRMLETMDSSIKDENIKDKNGVVVTGGNLFRKYLLNRCQEEFERGWKVNLPDQTKAAGEEVTMLSDEYYIAAAAKRRGLGLVQFIGELFKLGMLTERIMNECVRKLLDFEGLPEDETVESLSKLLRTIGGQLDSSEKSNPIMDVYFGRITAMIENKELNSRMRFMLMDIVDLRKRKWESNEKDKGPKTIQEVREEALKAQLEKEAISKANRNRPQPGRGDSRYPGGGGGGGGYQQSHHDNKTSGTLNTDELTRLKNRSGQRSSSTTHFGPVSSLSPRSNSSRRGMQDSGSRTPSAPVSTSSPNMFSALLQDSSQHDGNETASSPPSNNNSPQVSNARPVTEEA